MPSVQPYAFSGVSGYTNSTRLGSQMDESDGLAWGPDGLLYLTDNNHGTVRRIDEAGDTVSTFKSGLAAPENLEFDPNGDLWVGGTGAQNHLYKLDGSTAATLVDINIQQADTPAYNPADGKMYYSAFLTDIRRVNLDGTGDAMVWDNSMVQVEGMAFDADGVLWVMDYGRGWVIRVPPPDYNSGTVVATTDVNLNQGIAVGADGWVYYSRTELDQVWRYDPVNDVAYPYLTGVPYINAIDFGPDGLIYVIDSVNDRVYTQVRAGWKVGRVVLGNRL